MHNPLTLNYLCKWLIHNNQYKATEGLAKNLVFETYCCTDYNVTFDSERICDMFSTFHISSIFVNSYIYIYIYIFHHVFILTYYIFNLWICLHESFIPSTLPLKTQLWDDIIIVMLNATVDGPKRTLSPVKVNIVRMYDISLQCAVIETTPVATRGSIIA